jgi:hypothetical protein
MTMNDWYTNVDSREIWKERMLARKDKEMDHPKSKTPRGNDRALEHQDDQYNCLDYIVNWCVRL